MTLYVSIFLGNYYIKIFSELTSYAKKWNIQHKHNKEKEKYHLSQLTPFIMIEGTFLSL